MIFIIYLLSIVDKIVGVSVFIGVISLGITIRCLNLMYDERAEPKPDNDYIHKLTTYAKKSATSLVICLCIFTFTPKKEYIAAMYIAPKVIDKVDVDTIRGETKELYLACKDILISKASKKEDN